MGLSCQEYYYSLSFGTLIKIDSIQTISICFLFLIFKKDWSVTTSPKSIHFQFTICIKMRKMVGKTKHKLDINTTIFDISLHSDFLANKNNPGKPPKPPCSCFVKPHASWVDPLALAGSEPCAQRSRPIPTPTQPSLSHGRK